MRDDFPRLTPLSFGGAMPVGIERVEYEVNLDSFDHLCVARSSGEAWCCTFGSRRSIPSSKCSKSATRTTRPTVTETTVSFFAFSELSHPIPNLLSHPIDIWPPRHTYQLDLSPMKEMGPDLPQFGLRFAPSWRKVAMGIDLQALASNFREHGGEMLATASLRFDRYS